MTDTEHPLALWHRIVWNRDPAGLCAALHVFGNPTIRYVRAIVGPAHAPPRTAIAP
jgi:hypothetical protein